MSETTAGEPPPGSSSHRTHNPLLPRRLSKACSVAPGPGATSDLTKTWMVYRYPPVLLARRPPIAVCSSAFWSNLGGANPSKSDLKRVRRSIERRGAAHRNEDREAMSSTTWGWFFIGRSTSSFATDTSCRGPLVVNWTQSKLVAERPGVTRPFECIRRSVTERSRPQKTAGKNHPTRL